MKRVAIGLLVVVVLGSVGFTSYRLVRYKKSSSQNKITSKTVERDKSTSTNSTPSIEKKVENSNESLSGSSPNNSPSTSSNSESILFNTSNSGERFDFSSADAFILCYNQLVNDLGSNVTKEDVYSSESKARLIYSSVGNLIISSYQFDNQIKDVIIKGEDKVSKVEGYLDGKAKVKFENGNTVIYDIIYNNH